MAERPGLHGQSEEAPDVPRRPSGRVARNRRKRADEFLAAALRIVIDDGLESLTMARLAAEVDAAVGSVYQYYPSKEHLMAAVQSRAVERLGQSFDESIPPLVASAADRLGKQSARSVPVVVLGRWACAAAVVLPEEVRLLQVIAAQRTSSLGPGGGDALAPTVMAFVARVAAIIDEAAAAGAISEGSSLPRAIMWLTGVGGVLAAEDLAAYLPDVLGDFRLAKQFTIDLCVGWGGDRTELEAIDRTIDEIARSAPLVRYTD